MNNPNCKICWLQTYKYFEWICTKYKCIVCEDRESVLNNLLKRTDKDYEFAWELQRQYDEKEIIKLKTLLKI